MAMPEEVIDEEQEDTSKFTQQLDTALGLIKDDVCEWLSEILVLSPPIQCDRYLDFLDNGVVMCRLMKLIEETENGSLFRKRFHNLAPPGSFLARDNVSIFLSWCKKRMRDELLFETSGLVDHREERNIVLTLLELGRLCLRLGMNCPQIVRIESEMDKGNFGNYGGDMGIGSTSSSGTAESPEAVYDPESDTASVSSDSAISDMASEGPSVDDVTGGLSRLQVRSASADVLDEEEEKVRVEAPRPRRASEQLPVRTRNPPPPPQQPVAPKLIVHTFKNTEMVRVGGGWITLKDYLVKHAPSRIGRTREGRNEFFVAKGKVRYKPGLTRPVSTVEGGVVFPKTSPRNRKSTTPGH